jgi:biotin-(acetyl-CoA carboxylase) ligase
MGSFRDLDGDGSLIVELSDGSLRKIAAGEVFLPQT